MEQRDDNNQLDAATDTASRDWSPVVQEHAQRLLRVVEPVARAASGFSGFFSTMAIVSTVAAAVLLLLLFAGIEGFTVWKMALAIVVSILLLLPGAVLGIFWIGLRQLIVIPGELAEALDDFGQRSDAAFADASADRDGRGRVRGLLRFVRSLVDVRSTVLQSRDVLTKSLVLVRVANPVSLVVVLVATAFACLLVLIASAAAILFLTA
jgi:hypothetical protein